jgi:acyl-CoA reductase-like NAD-dependent aldehyde dehydrogenase
MTLSGHHQHARNGERLPREHAVVSNVSTARNRATAAQHHWRSSSMARRVKCLRRARNLIASEAAALAHLAASTRHRPIPEILTSEVLPLADACRFLERHAIRILRPRRLGPWGRPAWLGQVTATVCREPVGIVLIIAPSNYPLFLPGVQILQALAAGNAVLFKPGKDASPVARAFVNLLASAGFDPDLIQILPESPNAASEAIDVGVDKIFLTGSAHTGKTILTRAAQTLTPATMELSGCDAAFVLPDANLHLVARALNFGLRLNNGNTCLAPRRVFVPRAIATELEGQLTRTFSQTLFPIHHEVHPSLAPLVHEALQQGAHLIIGESRRDGTLHGPLVIADAPSTIGLLSADLFYPVMVLVTVTDLTEALAIYDRCPYALGASVFSRNTNRARHVATQINAGTVTINDLIVPTADPRLPFGGRKQSGFGLTRGPEGLLEMTTPKVITVTRGSFRPHFRPPQPADAAAFQAFIRLSHARRWGTRIRAFGSLLRAILGPFPRHNPSPQPQSTPPQQ